MVLVLVFMFSISCWAMDEERPINDAISSPLLHPHIVIPNESLLRARDEVTHQWAHDLLRSQGRWSLIASVSECLAQVCGVTTPVLAAFAAGFKNEQLMLVSMSSGVLSVGFNRFGHYAQRESIHSAEAANKILQNEGIAPIVVINTTLSRTGSS